MLKCSGIYKIYNKKSNKYYIGSSSRCVHKRMKEHIRLLRESKHNNSRLQFSYNKHGEEAFIFELLEECSPELCLKIEQKWIDFYKSYDDNYGYNIEIIAGNSFGTRRTEKQKENISKSLVGKRSGNKNHRYGKHWGEEEKEQFRKSMPHSKPVLQIDVLNNKVIKEFDSIRHAAIFLGGDKSPISKVCWGVAKHITAYGYKWKFKT